ncbi:uncharacterized protein F5147DRAFT_712860 [Suillus discolor]|uniref:Uncharacterized protein n=1 Tax=Suillus discolor TaxID=1912936 RepID=A0A9P7JQI8_9AGAM|nr:uncharacterized protein F5147DRAFT_712860 [Suillus discolor]KAG2098944.1 hypothetical protein F5147DRAFT_712860 [Suillus discolor]
MRRSTTLRIRVTRHSFSLTFIISLSSTTSMVSYSFLHDTFVYVDSQTHTLVTVSPFSLHRTENCQPLCDSCHSVQTKPFRFNATYSLPPFSPNQSA